MVLVEGLGSQCSLKKVDPVDATELRYAHELLPRHLSSARIFAYSPPTSADGDLDPLFSVEGLTGAAEALLRVLEKQRKKDKTEYLEKSGTGEETEASTLAL